MTLLTTKITEEKPCNDDLKKMTSEIIAKTLEVGQPGDAQFTVRGPDGTVIAANSAEEEEVREKLRWRNCLTFSIYLLLGIFFNTC